MPSKNITTIVALVWALLGACGTEIPTPRARERPGGLHARLAEATLPRGGLVLRPELALGALPPRGTASPADASPPPPPPPPPPPAPSAAEQRVGINVDPANPAGNPSAAALKAAGVRWVRVEWKASHGSALYDPILAAYRQAGLKVLLLVDYASAPGKPPSNASDSAWTAYLGSFEQVAEDLAAHYKDSVDAWQLWNEPDLFNPGSGYDPGVPAKHYGALLAGAAPRVRAHSTRPVITAGLASGDPGYLAQVKAAANGLPVDAVAIHPYGQRAPDDWPQATWGFGNMSTLINAYLKQAAGKPIWISEIGTDNPSASFAADYLENVYAMVAATFPSQVPRVFWFCWSDGMVSSFGIHDAAGNPKPAGQRYQSIAGAW